MDVNTRMDQCHGTFPLIGIHVTLLLTKDSYKHKAVSKGEICDSVIGKDVDRIMDGLSARMFLSCIKPDFLSRLLASTSAMPG